MNFGYKINWNVSSQSWKLLELEKDIPNLSKLELARKYFLEANINNKESHHQMAISKYDKAIQLDPYIVGIYYNRGNSKYNLGQYAGAVEDFNKTIELNPKNADAYNNRGLCKWTLGQYDAAIQDYDNALKVCSRDAEIYNNRGRCKNSQNRDIEAVLDYDIAIELNPDYCESFFNRGSTKHLLGQFEEAILDFNKAIELNPKISEIFNNRGISKYSLGRLSDAILDYDKAIELNPNNASVYSNRGNTKDNLGQFKSAMQDHNIAIQLSPNFANAYTNRGGSKNMIGSYAAAINDFDSSVKINPFIAETYSNRGYSKSKLGQDVAAILDYEKAIELNSQYANAYIYRGNSLYKLKRTQDAIESYCKAIPLCMGLLSTQQQYVHASPILKFRTINTHSLTNISEQKIWFAHPDTFNDADDGGYLRVLFPNNTAILKLLESVLVYSCFGIPKVNELKTAKGVEFSNTQRQLMWAHYGDSSKGICMHYKYSPEQAKLAKQFTLDSVRYAETIVFDGNASLYDVIRNGFFTKKSTWQSEKECRFIAMAGSNAVRLEDGACLGQMVNESDLGLTLCGVEFGLKCSPDDVLKVKAAIQLRDNASEIKLYQVKSGSFDNPLTWSTVEMT